MCRRRICLWRITAEATSLKSHQVAVKASLPLGCLCLMDWPLTPRAICLWRITARRRRRMDSARVRVARVCRHALHVDADRRPCDGRLRAAGLPDQRSASCSRCLRRCSDGRRPRLPPHSVCVECKRRGERLCDGRPRQRPAWAGHPGRLRRALPGLRPRLLRLLRADGDARTLRAGAATGALGMDPRESCARLRTFNASASRSAGQSERA